MGKLQMTWWFMYGILLFFSLNALWITKGSARSDYQESREIQAVVEHPFLTPILNTEPIPFRYSESNEVTSAAAAGDIYDQISPSRNPTTPLSRMFIHSQRNHQEKINNPSTLPTMLSAPPPPLYYRTP